MNKTVAVQLNCQPDYIDEARYVFQTLFKIIGLPYREINQAKVDRSSRYVLISYGQHKPDISQAQSLIHFQEASYWKLLSKISPKQIAWMEKHASFTDSPHTPQKLLYLFSSSIEALPNVYYLDKDKKYPIITAANNQIKCAADIVSSAFYFLSLQNEYLTKQRDEYGRFLKRYSPLGEVIYDTAQVDLYANLIQGMITNAAHSINLKVEYQPRWPKKHPFAICLSHDVDRIRSWTLSKVKRTLRTHSKNRNLLKLANSSGQIISSLLNPKNWSGNLQFIVELERLYGGSSTFFFVSGKGSEKDPRYNLSSPRFKKRFETLKKGDHEIGLHGSFNSFENSTILEQEKMLLEGSGDVEVIGLRQHYLRFSLDKSFDAWEVAGFAYDSTLGFADKTGYRAGISFPYQPFSKRKRSAYHFWEIPLVIMDTILLLEDKLFLDANNAWSLIQEYLENTLLTGGCLTLNWHNNNIHPQDITGYSQLYEKILGWAKERNAWICSLDELCEWWQNKET